MSNYRWGYVALVDALGFKGIYDRHDPEEVLQEMQRIKHLIEEEFRSYQRSNAMLINAVMGLRFMSDTVALSLQFDSDSFEGVGETRARFAIFTMCELLLELTNQWATSSIPLAFRGAIAAGKFCAHDEFIVGECIDEAAELHEQPQGAFICLAKSIPRKLISLSGSSKSSNVAFIPFDVQLKNGKSKRMAVLHVGHVRQNRPNNSNPTDQELQGMILTTFNSKRADVKQKMRNTDCFFEKTTQVHFD